MASVPNDILFKYSEMGYGEMIIRQCWAFANGDENLFNAYLFDEIPLPQLVSASIPYQIEQRTNDQYVGLLNVGNTCSINSVLQYFYQIPQLFKLIIECQNGKKEYEKFVFEIQILFTQLLASNQKFVNPKQAIQSISWEAQEKEYIGVQQDIVEIFNLLLNKFDKSIRRLHNLNIMETNIQRVELFGNQQLNELFQIIFINENNQKEYHPNLVATLKYKNIRTFLSQEFRDKILELPKFLRISINRIIFQDRYIQKQLDEFIIDDILNLDLCMKQNINSNEQEKIAQLQNEATNLQKEISTQKSYLSSLSGVIKVYEDEGIFVDLIYFLKNKYEQLQKQIISKQNIYKEKQKIINSKTQIKFQYRIHSIVIHFGSAQEGHNFIYIYNFYLEQWMKYNDITISFVHENVVEQDVKMYGQIVTYVNQEMIPQLRDHYKFIKQIGDIIIAQPNKDLSKIQELSQIPQNVLAAVTKDNQDFLNNF